MNYRRIYNQLVMKAWRRGGVDVYKEKHHIIPRCQGGGNGKDNLVDFTAAEHYIAHLLLMKMYPDFHKLAFPLFMMAKNLGRGTKNKLYDKAKRVVSEGKKGKKPSDEARIKMSEARIGKKHSDEAKAKMSEVKKGVALSEEHKAKISVANKGKKKSEETRTKMSISSKGKKRTPESIAKQLATRTKNKEREEILQFWCAL